MKNMTLGGGARRWLIVAQALAAAMPVAPFVMGCSQSGMDTTHRIDIRYIENCPDRVNTPLDQEVQRGDHVEWQSVEIVGGEKKDVVRKYWIYFDPFVGKTLGSDHNGMARSKPIDPGAAQEADYKYTVVSPDDETGNPTCPALDPRLRVGRT